MSTVKIPRPDLAALALCALIVVAIVALKLARVDVPDVLPYLATAALSAGAGLSLNSPGTIGTETIRTSGPSPAPASRPASSSVPAPRPAAPAQDPRVPA